MVCVIETDKVSVDVRAPEAGVVSKLLAKEGDEIAVGSPLFEISAGDSPAQSKKSETKAAAPATNAPASSPGGPAKTISVPSMGDSITEGTVSTWTAAEGESVDADQVWCASS